MEQLAACYCRMRQQFPEQFFVKNLFAVERIIIPSRSMRQWLERTMADQGVFLSNVEFLNIRSFISELLKKQFSSSCGEEYFPEKFARRSMTWRITELLQTSLAEFPELQSYLQKCAPEESVAIRRYSLAEKKDALFSRCLEETPELLACEKAVRTLPENWFAIAFGRLLELAEMEK